MKILHTGDWHIGKIVNEFSMLEDQEFALEQLIAVIEKEKPDVVIIAGDIYDRSIPPVEAVELLDRVFNTILIDLKTPIIAIAGNHDGRERLSFASKLLTRNGLHIAGSLDKEIKKVTFNSEHSPVTFYMLPYADPKEIRHILKDEEITNHDSAMEKMIGRIKKDIEANHKHVLIAHGYVSHMRELDQCKLVISDSERPLSIGGTEIVNSKHFDCFHYTALGHLHSPQKVGSDRMRYAGSLLKYSFSEVNQKKGFTIVDIDANGEVSIELRELLPSRDMRIIKGPLHQLIDPKVYETANQEDYVYAILTDEQELIDPISKLRAVYPNIMGLSRESTTIRGESRTAAVGGHKNKSKLELFQEFYQSISSKPLDSEKLIIAKAVIEQVEREAQ
ncbi:exonuclease SbcCD subunit D [Desulfuribacillus alkaliarsenatis]|uniref:Nuclease SbcCD subunit D n=1 Tax=Desulfuribacillus alkaliarsenatis TaxID=766136 RepID=A0A1E5G342_9FIRM|nr:exonuclease SbcCD subunit D [Desulfuribacillus alkaliarsenatis]OEF97390.1 exonuclease sbcCD subunit D [Desulfuribacillus alkaliarsenatis]